MGGPFARMSAEARRKLIEAMDAQKADAEQPTTDAAKTVQSSAVNPIDPAEVVETKNIRRARASEKKKKKSSLLKTRGLLADSN